MKITGTAQRRSSSSPGNLPFSGFYLKTISIALLFLALSCSSGNRFREHHIETFENVLHSQTMQRAHLEEMFGNIITGSDIVDGKLSSESVLNRWNVLYGYMEVLNAQLQAHRDHMVDTGDTMTFITDIITANAEMLNFCLINSADVEGAIRLGNTDYLKTLLATIRKHSLEQFDAILSSLQSYIAVIEKYRS